MIAFLAAAVGLTSAAAAVPLETQALGSLRQAQRNLSAGERPRALALLDSLVMRDGVSVSMEAPGAMAPSVAKGVEAWDEALGEPAFRLRPDGAPADVTVRFVPSIEALGGDAQGMVQATRQISWSDHDHNYRLHGVILVRDNVEGRPLRADEVVNVVAHECGHLLGLADVDRTDRLMGPMVVGHPRFGPTVDEVDAVRDYRALIRRTYPKG